MTAHAVMKQHVQSPNEFTNHLYSKETYRFVFVFDYQRFHQKYVARRWD